MTPAHSCSPTDGDPDAQRRARALAEFLDEWEREHGPFTDEELTRADEELGFGRDRDRDEPSPA